MAEHANEETSVDESEDEEDEDEQEDEEDLEDYDEDDDDDEVDEDKDEEEEEDSDEEDEDEDIPEDEFIMQAFDWSEKDLAPPAIQSAQGDLQEKVESDTGIPSMGSWGGSWSYGNSTNPFDPREANHVSVHRSIADEVQPHLESITDDQKIHDEGASKEMQPSFFLDPTGNEIVQAVMERVKIDMENTITEQSRPAPEYITLPTSPKPGKKKKTHRGKRAFRSRLPENENQMEKERNRIIPGDDIYLEGDDDVVEHEETQQEHDKDYLELSGEKAEAAERSMRDVAVMDDYIQNTGGIEELQKLSYLSMERDPTEKDAESGSGTDSMEVSEEELVFSSDDSDDSDSDDDSDEQDDDDIYIEHESNDETDSDEDGRTYFERDAMSSVPKWKDDSNAKPSILAESSSNPLFQAIKKYNEEKFRQVLNGDFERKGPMRAVKQKKSKGKERANDRFDIDHDDFALNDEDFLTEITKEIRITKNGKSQLKKEKRRAERQKKQEMIAQGIIPGSAGKKAKKAAAAIHDKRQRNGGGIDFQHIRTTIEDFLNDWGLTTVSLQPMPRDFRRHVHALALQYNLKSRSMGSGARRYPTFTKTARSCIPTDSRQIDRLIAIAEADVHVSASNQRRPGGNDTPSSNYNKKRNNGTGLILPPGTVVGASAPPLPVSNVGHRMLLGMGWSTGQSLGANSGANGSFTANGNENENSGSPLLVPLTAVVRARRVGLGHSMSDGPGRY